jgi:vesicle transport through interaction with t-SNAREs protein 1
MSTPRLAQSGDRIKESKRQMIETEELGVSILQDLNQQRQTLLHTQNTLLSVDDSVGKSRHILGSMNQRMSQHKWIIVTVIAVLVLAIALIVYVKMHSKRS